MYEKSELSSVREKLQNFLNIFDKYSVEIYGRRRQRVLDRLRTELQRRQPEVTKLLSDFIDTSAILRLGSFGQTMQLTVRDLLPTALLGGNNELTFNFADYQSTVQAVLNRAIGVIDSGITRTSKPERLHKGLKATATTINNYYVSPARIEELKSISPTPFDTTKLVRMCEELNIAYNNKCNTTIAMITRAIMDHVPPLLGFSTFAEIANNYKGTRSFTDSMKHLEESLRNIADSILHTPIRNKETLPTFVQVNFAADLDVLFGEIIRVNKK